MARILRSFAGKAGRSALALTAACAAVWLTACLNQEECRGHSDCAPGRFCSKDNFCDFQCRSDLDCGADCSCDLRFGLCIAGKATDLVTGQGRAACCTNSLVAMSVQPQESGSGLCIAGPDAGGGTDAGVDVPADLGGGAGDAGGSADGPSDLDLVTDGSGP